MLEKFWSFAGYVMSCGGYGLKTSSFVNKCSVGSFECSVLKRSKSAEIASHVTNVMLEKFWCAAGDVLQNRW